MNTRPSPPHLCLIGVPTDAGAGLQGARLGPGALRAAGLVPTLQQQGVRVHDHGDLDGPSAPAPSGGAFWAEVHVWSRQVADAVQAALTHGQVPMVLGGDHSLAVGSIAAVAHHCRRKGLRLQVLWLDAHADCNTPATSPSGHVHGMPLACLLGEGPAELTGLLGPGPVLRPDQVSLLGVRSIDPGEAVFLRRHGLEVVRFTQGQALVEGLAQVLARGDAHTHVHLSLDLDVLEPACAPGVSTPEPGGPDFAQMLRCMQCLADDGRVGSVDLVELNPLRDVQGSTARLAVGLMARLWSSGGQNTQSKPVVINR